MCTGTHPYIPVADVVEVKLLYSTTGGEALNVLNFKLQVAPTHDSLEALALDIKAWFNAQMKTLSNSGCALQQIICTDLSTQNGPQVIYTTDLPIACTGGSSLPNNVTVAVKHTTDNRGRSYRGRSYVVGPPTTAIDSGDHVSNAYAGAVKTAFDSLLAGDFVANNEEFVVVSRCQDNVWLALGVATPITANSVEQTFDSQRRRLFNRGI